MIEVISNPVQVEIINNPLAVAITIEPIAVEIVGGIQGPPGQPGSGGAAMIWQIVTSSQTTVANNGYQYDGSALGVFPLPEDPVNGDRVSLHRIGAGNWQVKSDVHSIYVLGTLVPPVTGYAQSMDLGGVLELTYTGGDRWEAVGIFGNIEVA